MSLPRMHAEILAKLDFVNRNIRRRLLDEEAEESIFLSVVIILSGTRRNYKSKGNVSTFVWVHNLAPSKGDILPPFACHRGRNPHAWCAIWGMSSPTKHHIKRGGRNDFLLLLSVSQNRNEKWSHFLWNPTKSPQHNFCGTNLTRHVQTQHAHPSPVTGPQDKKNKSRSMPMKFPDTTISPITRSALFMLPFSLANGFITADL